MTGSQRRPRLGQGFPGGQRALGLAALAGLALGGFALSQSERAARAKAETQVALPSAREVLAAKVKPGPLQPKEHRALHRLVSAARPLGADEGYQYREFYFDGDATLCGQTDPVRVTHARRFIAKNGHVIVEGDLSRLDFAELWAICEAGGA